MTKWTLQDVSKIQKIEPKAKTIKLTTKPKGLLFIENFLKYRNIPFTTEFKFSVKRKFKFDIAIPELRIAIEYEGLISSKSRHTNVTGYTGDCEKYNLAQLEGWKVLRYTILNFKNIENDFEFIKK